jgi:hypothetical protein
MADSKDWREIRAELALNEDLVAAYGEVMELPARLAKLRRDHGVSYAAIAETLSISETEAASLERPDDPRLTELAKFVVALGGRMEVRAVFPEETVTLLSGSVPETGGSAKG